MSAMHITALSYGRRQLKLAVYIALVRQPTENSIVSVPLRIRAVLYAVSHQHLLCTISGSA